MSIPAPFLQYFFLLLLPSSSYYVFSAATAVLKNADTRNEEEENSSSMSTNSIIGLAFGVLGIVLVLGLLLWAYMHSRSKKLKHRRETMLTPSLHDGNFHFQPEFNRHSGLYDVRSNASSGSVYNTGMYFHMPDTVAHAASRITNEPKSIAVSYAGQNEILVPTVPLENAFTGDKHVYGNKKLNYLSIEDLVDQKHTNFGDVTKKKPYEKDSSTIDTNVHHSKESISFHLNPPDVFDTNQKLSILTDQKPSPSKSSKAAAAARFRRISNAVRQFITHNSEATEDYADSDLVSEDLINNSTHQFGLFKFNNNWTKILPSQKYRYPRIFGTSNNLKSQHSPAVSDDMILQNQNQDEGHLNLFANSNDLDKRKLIESDRFLNSLENAVFKSFVSPTGSTDSSAVISGDVGRRNAFSNSQGNYFSHFSSFDTSSGTYSISPNNALVLQSMQAGDLSISSGWPNYTLLPPAMPMVGLVAAKLTPTHSENAQTEKKSSVTTDSAIEDGSSGTLKMCSENSLQHASTDTKISNDHSSSSLNSLLLAKNIKKSIYQPNTLINRQISEVQPDLVIRNKHSKRTESIGSKTTVLNFSNNRPKASLSLTEIASSCPVDFDVVPVFHKKPSSSANSITRSPYLQI